MDLKSIILFVISCFLVVTGKSQSFSSQDPDYIANVNAGERALLSENYDSCVHYYNRAFKIKQSSFLSTLRAAACGFSAGKTLYFREQLQKAMDIDWDGTKNIFYSYPEFKYLHETEFEAEMEDLWIRSAEAAGINLDLMMELAYIRELDQRERQQMGEMEQLYGWDSPQMDSLWRIQIDSDQANLKRIEAIFKKHGYPGKSLVGPAQSVTAFLVIQHADLDTQEKYLDLIVEAADNDEVPWSSVALLVDRVRMRNGKSQIYGSQVSRDDSTGNYFFAKIENPEKIDSIRSSVGLGPISEYAKNWNIEWDPKKHKSRFENMREK